jgi:hypothetical protein
MTAAFAVARRDGAICQKTSNGAAIPATGKRLAERWNREMHRGRATV